MNAWTHDLQMTWPQGIVTKGSTLVNKRWLCAGSLKKPESQVESGEEKGC